MKTLSAVLAATLLLASNGALAATQDNSNTYVATIDPPTGSKNCGFSLSGDIKYPKAVALAYGFFFRSELNIVTALNRAHPIKEAYFPGPGTLHVTAESKEFDDDSDFQKRKFIQAQLRIWYAAALMGKVEGGGPQSTPLSESVWVDIPASTVGCVANRMQPATGLSSPASGNSATLPNPVAPAPNSAPTGPKHIRLQRVQ
jgi:hypothetical protein